MSIFTQTEARIQQVCDFKSTILFYRLCVHAGVMFDSVKVSREGVWFTTSYKAEKRTQNPIDKNDHEAESFAALCRSIATAHDMGSAVCSLVLLEIAVEELARLIPYYIMHVTPDEDIPF